MSLFKATNVSIEQDKDLELKFSARGTEKSAPRLAKAPPLHLQRFGKWGSEKRLSKICNGKQEIVESRGVELKSVGLKGVSNSRLVENGYSQCIVFIL